MIFDTHTHYSDHRFDNDRHSLLISMEENGIGNIVEVGAGLKSTKEAVKLSEEYSFIYAAVGIHPYETADIKEEDMEWIKSLTLNEKVVAVGEIGLDYHYSEPSRQVQKKWFIRQLEIAKETGLPIIIHSRDAAEDTLNIMKTFYPANANETNGVVHCFSYSPEIAKIYIDMGFYLGIGGVVTFKNSKKLIDVVSQVTLDRLVLETDAPYLTPEPHRNERNSSLNLEYVARKTAEIKGITMQEVIKVTERNARELYRL
ncbi:MAG: TatD family hydrolase [Lachnospiraceae bacterium]|nr:TatD family hydrolase [Lachnospiraceae bacterium]